MFDKIIFLDIDGVLVTRRSIMEKKHHEAFDPICISNLNKIILNTECKIVISSTWRFLYTIDDLKIIFKNVGIINTIIGTTGKDGNIRGDEIQLWLLQNPTNRFCIIDDDSDMGNLMDKLVLTTFDKGIEGFHVQQAIHFLGDKEYE